VTPKWMAAIKAVVTAGIKSEVEFRANSQIALSLLAIGRERLPASIRQGLVA
jgi:hypothetical protein